VLQDTLNMLIVVPFRYSILHNNDCDSFMKYVLAWLVFLAGSVCYADMADSLLRAGIKHHTAKEFRKAVTLYTDAIRHGNDTYVIYYNRGICYNELDVVDSAIADLRTALQRRPNDTSALYAKATAFTKIKKYDSALVALDTLLSIVEAFPNSQSLRGQLYLARRDTARACADFTKAARRGDALAADLKRKFCDGLIEKFVATLPAEDGWKEATVQMQEDVRITTYTRGSETVTEWTQLYGTMKIPGAVQDVISVKDMLVAQARTQGKNVSTAQIAQDTAIPPRWVVFTTEMPTPADGSYAESNIWCVRVGEVSTFVVHLDVRGGKLDPQLVTTWSGIFKLSRVE